MIDLITITFNKPHLIEWQIKLLRRFMQEEYQLTVVDNSDSLDRRDVIEGICQREAVRCFWVGGVGTNPSNSHGSAINWGWRYLLKGSQSRYFGFLDHDVFPVAPTTLTPKLDKGAYGILQHREERWYLWPGFCFFDREWLNGVNGGKLNFLPVPGMDTGGANYDLLFRHMRNDEFRTPSDMVKRRCRTVENPELLSPQLDEYETWGGWLHCLNGSDWTPPRVGEPTKWELMLPILEKAYNA
jgi:hypothetical protein